MPIRKMLDLLLLGENLLVQQVDLLCWDGVLMRLGLLSRSRGFPTDIVKRLFTVGAKFGVLKLPGLVNKV